MVRDLRNGRRSDDWLFSELPSTMNCVNCKEPMIVLELHDVEIDHCVNCGGIWLDAGELSLLLEDERERSELLERPVRVGEARSVDRKCPICLKKMEEIIAAEDSGVYVDRCRSRHGLWFDRGELRKLLRIIGGDGGNKIVRLLEDMLKPPEKGK
jgi:hypothetical protein